MEFGNKHSLNPANSTSQIQPSAAPAEALREEAIEKYPFTNDKNKNDERTKEE